MAGASFVFGYEKIMHEICITLFYMMITDSSDGSSIFLIAAEFRMIGKTRIQTGVSRK